MRLIIKWVTAITLILSSFLLSTYKWTTGEYNYDSNRKFENFEAFYQNELEISKKENTKPNNEEYLIRVSEEPTPIAILYLHGFGASRGEGEEVTNKLSEYFGANTYYVRLPGHGTNIEDHLNTPFQKYLQDAEDSLIYTKELGHKTVVIGTSMGGNIATYLAAKHPELIDSLILASPFYDFDDPTAHLFRFYWGKSFIDSIKGEIRISKTDPKDESAKYWYLDQYYGAIQNILDLKRFMDKENPYPKVSAPTLLMYYYKSEREHDFVASINAMFAVFDSIQSGPNANAKNRLLKIEDGAHVLLSKYVKTDKALIEKEMIQFIKDTTGAEEVKKSKKTKR
ncbi:alpha/beta hydrolase family protein [Leptospira yanagawae serovar Saopaulo str. Sao Paulo = ATCC 700523]|uniref:Alpha/beta hydrolase family protein n=1 Tax=Leptospira yanagawae serovar Saopaulo str. Sao Paulo = ATCC 700523 TaxID=1249483 RepID=A0A5E8HCU0_9LEPT|nr:alpha/beta hydrolase [Leptospira yanagawae]EOQ87846.1 alpha/beta hydrolase family protein [Leptospira yanagawae serovar Saopaulo str. Sao Paulo = ATCC 700523]